MKNFAKYLFIFLIAHALFWVIAYLRSGNIEICSWSGIPLSCIMGFIIMCTCTIICLKTFKNLNQKYIILSIFLGISLLEIPFRIGYFQSMLMSLPSYLIWCLGILTGGLIVKVKSNYIKMVIFISSVFLLLTSKDIYNSWLQKLNFGTFTGKTEQMVENPIIFQNIEGEYVALNDFRGKHVVLDFWSSTCGVCFAKFPEVQKTYQEYKNTPDIKICSVFCRMDKKNETIKTGNDLLTERGYTFPVLAMDINDPVLAEIGVDGFPTVIIFDPDGKLVFRGSIEYAQKYLNKLNGR